MKAHYKNEDINILIVDDNTQNIQVIGQILWQKKYNVIFATSGDEALDVLKSGEKFDLILLDILMPKMNGFEVCSKIRENPILVKVPIIFLTAKADKESIVEGFRKGANDYVVKPFHEEELLLRVETQLKLTKQNELLDNYNQKLELEVFNKTKALQKANLQLGKLESAKSNFLSLISHELRTPLNIVNGFIEIMLDNAQDEYQTESLKILKKSANRLISLSKTALLITEIQLGSYSLEKEEVKLADACRSAITLLNDELDDEEKPEYLIVKNQDEITVNGDFDLIVNMIKLICENSVEATKQPCKLTFRLTYLNNETSLEIGDNGPGFSQTDLDGLFNIFSKNGPDPNHKGFGLSLTAVMLSMELHGGIVTVKNRDEGGACVRLVFKE